MDKDQNLRESQDKAVLAMKTNSHRHIVAIVQGKGEYKFILAKKERKKVHISDERLQLGTHLDSYCLAQKFVFSSLDISFHHPYKFRGKTVAIVLMNIMETIADGIIKV